MEINEDSLFCHPPVLGLPLTVVPAASPPDSMAFGVQRDSSHANHGFGMGLGPGKTVVGFLPINSDYF